MDFRELFYFNKSDRAMLLFLLVAAAVAIIAVYGLGGEGGKGGGTAQNDTTETLRRPARQWGGTETRRTQRESYGYAYAVEGKAERFAFDPNTADSTQLLRLGLRPWQVRNIYKYRAAGGVYRKPADFAKLYGLTVKQYRELEPYIRISGDYSPAAALFPEERLPQRDTIERPRKIAPGERVDISTADTSALQRVPGIGPYYARQIVRYRERLGGYVSVRQLEEIGGFPPEALPFMEVGAAPVRKMNVNRLTLEQMRRHPYMSFYKAKAICDYRRLKGPLPSLDDLKLLADFPPEDIAKLAPYVEF